MDENLPPFSILSEEKIFAAIMWFDQMSRPEMWNIEVGDKLLLLGDIPAWYYVGLLNGRADLTRMRTTKDVLERISLLLGFSKCLEAIVGKNNVSFGFTQPNSHELFCGRSIIRFLIASNSVGEFHVVKRYFLNQVYG